jgi:hypothetical protein
MQGNPEFRITESEIKAWQEYGIHGIGISQKTGESSSWIPVSAIVRITL